MRSVRATGALLLTLSVAGLPSLGYSASKNTTPNTAATEEQTQERDVEDILADALEAFERAKRKRAQGGNSTESPDSAGSENPQTTPTASNDDPASGNPGDASTNRSADGDRRLDEALGGFDKVVLRERKRVEKSAENEGLDGEEGDEELSQNEEFEIPPLPSGKPGGGSAGGRDSGQQDRGGPRSGQAGKSSGEESQDAGKNGSGGGVEVAKKRDGDYEDVSVYEQLPADIPDGSDDDVVARQLREAALREKDPKLRERLWDEYRKYKGIARK